ncbi:MULTISPECIES: HAD family hydrolase [Providencia]|uniref:Phosphoserine phosphatase n=1 Tax=Providencia heimbachae ATCC 35613 TaxID=1354272 RepID=A0A1B7JRQ2_9GAMM|nr:MULTISPECIES: HAD family hydrolase [Providencia]MBP6123135.1 HAD-IB family hydrolase [Providencia sp.]NIH21105.1 HAD-IB family hydrolase [Providencia heimbachae]OAT50589.1 phosphoserine phosphatase [Providencia heimbachae ATCC 35613]QCJ68721.1 HAD-IB family hydrolase [Providencia heimbachae]SQH11740.1 ACT domain-containing protein [Providencia heimbachae]
MQNKLAIFDLDDTIVQGDSSVLWTQYLWDKKIITDPRFVEADKEMMVQYNAGSLDMVTYLKFSMQALSGMKIEQVDLWLDNFVDTIILPRIYPEAVKTIATYRSQEIPIIVISATVTFIVKKIAERLNADIVMGIDIKQKDGCYSTETEGIPTFKEGKVKRLMQWISHQPITDAYIYFYTDSANDLPMCHFADETFIVNGDERLTQAAKENNWPQYAWSL